MSNIDDAIAQLSSYFNREIGEIARLVVPHTDGDIEPSAASGGLYRKVLFVAMLDTLAGLRFHKKSFPELSKQNRARFSRFIKEYCSWSEAGLVSLPFLADKLKAGRVENRSLGKFVAEKLSRFSTEDGGTVGATELDERAAVLLSHATTEKEEAAISDCQHIQLLYRYRNRLVHESREPGNAMDVTGERSSAYYHGYVGEGTWYLCYPLGMFEQLCRNGLEGLRSYLLANSLDPYSFLDNAERW